jgi:hypothetical protein
MGALVHVVRAAEPGSRPLRGALVTLTNLSCHKAPPRPASARWKAPPRPARRVGRGVSD